MQQTTTVPEEVTMRFEVLETRPAVDMDRLPTPHPGLVAACLLLRSLVQEMNRRKAEIQEAQSKPEEVPKDAEPNNS